MKAFIILTLVFSSMWVTAQQKSEKAMALHGNMRRCTGSDYCSACKNCSACAHCNSGGTCGVCSPVVISKVSISKSKKRKSKK